MQPSRVVVDYSDKFYVYALYRKNGIPFYIGKGKGNRVNHHFRPSNLAKGGRKSFYIIKHRDEIRADILCYFDNEANAYDHEVWLINQYGLIDEGGVLLNYSKVLGNADYSSSFSSNVSSKSKENVLDRCKYSEDQVVAFYKLHFQQGYTGKTLEDLSGIPTIYSNYLIRGIKHKGLFDKWVKSGLISKTNNYEELVAERKVEAIVKEIDDETLTKHYVNLCYGNTNLPTICEENGYSESYVRSIFQGQKRKYLNFKISRDMIRPYRGLKTDDLINIIARVKQGQQISTLCREFDIPKTTGFRLYDQHKETDFSKELINLLQKFKLIESTNADNKA